MKRNKNLIIILIAGLIVFLSLCGAVIAYMFRQTEYNDNQFTPAEVSCDVLESFDGEKKTSIQVKNTGNIDAYLRVRLVSYWVDADGNVVAKPSSLPSFVPNNGWVKGSYDTYYFATPVAPNASTVSLLTDAITLRQEDGCMQVIEVFAEALQSKPTNAVTSAWGVSLDASGAINTAP